MGGEEDVKWVVIGWVVWVYGCKYKVVVLTAQGVIFLVLLALPGKIRTDTCETWYNQYEVKPASTATTKYW
jgi:hypothetical protein